MVAGSELASIGDVGELNPEPKSVFVAGDAEADPAPDRPSADLGDVVFNASTGARVVVVVS